MLLKNLKVSISGVGVDTVSHLKYGPGYAIIPLPLCALCGDHVSHLSFARINSL